MLSWEPRGDRRAHRALRPPESPGRRGEVRRAADQTPESLHRDRPAEPTEMPRGRRIHGGVLHYRKASTRENLNLNPQMMASNKNTHLGASVRIVKKILPKLTL